MMHHFVSVCRNSEATIQLDASFPLHSNSVFELRRQSLVFRYSVNFRANDVETDDSATDEKTSFIVQPTPPNENAAQILEPAFQSITLTTPTPSTPVAIRMKQHTKQTEAQKQRQEFQAQRMRKRATTALVDADVGDVVMISIPQNDRANVDLPNLACVVLQKTAQGSFRLATSAGVLKDTLFPGDIVAVSEQNAEYHGLGDVLSRWTFKTFTPLPNISLRQAASAISVVKGQGICKCSCSGDCSTSKCGCFRIDRKCGSRCHRFNSKCNNK
jgi:hypothetical protein